MAENAAAQIPGTVAEEVGKDIPAVVKHQLNILCCFSKNVDGMKEKAKCLKDKRDELQIKVSAKERNMEIIAPQVVTWLEATEGMIAKEVEIEDKISTAEGGCCANIKAPFSLGNEVKMTTEALEKLGDEVDKFHTISYPAPPPAVTLVPLGPIVALQSRKQIEDDIVEALSRPEVVNIVGIWGMGGVGKTTIAKKVLNRMMADKLVDEAVFVVVSQSLDLLKIQQEIAETLGFKDLEKEGTLMTRARQLLSRLSNKKILIVLDDIWKKFKLEDLGIPCEGRCITLLTSRHENLIKNQMGAQVFAMKTLSIEEARSLFTDKVGTCLKDNPHLVSIAEEILEECKGLPVAIITIGSALKDKPEKIWEGASRQLKSSKPFNIPDFIEDVYMSLRQSYLLLDSRDTQLLFLLCCLFPEDHDISLESLTLYSMGLNMFEDADSLEEARYQVHAEIEKLKSRCLLLDSHRKGAVKMHDVIRDVAIFIASEEGLIDPDLKSKGKSEKKCKWISECTMSSKEPLDHLQGSNFSNVRLLIIHNLSEIWSPAVLKISGISILKGMQGLNALSFRKVEFGSPHLETGSPNNLIALQLLSCNNLKSLSFAGDLLKLKILDCTDCEGIEELPAEIGRLNCLKLLNMSGCKKLQRIAPGVIKRLVGLEELKMLNSFNKWESSKVNDKEGMNVPLNELEALRKLTCLEIDIKDISLVHETIKLSPNLVKYRIRIQDRTYWIFKYEKAICLGRLPNEITNYGSWIHKLLDGATCTVEWLVLNGDGAGNWGNLSVTHHTLKGLKIAGCGMFKEAIDSSIMSVDSSGSGIFPMLEYLELDDLSNLKQVFSGQIPEGSISYRYLTELHLYNLPSLAYILKGDLNHQVPVSNLREVEIRSCGKLLNLFLLGRANDAFMQQLETLEIEECETMEQVFLSNESEKNGRATFPKLKRLKLRSLQSLTTFWKGMERIEFPSMEELEIIKCEEMKSMVSSGMGNESESEREREREHKCENHQAAYLCTHKVAFGRLKDFTLDNNNNRNRWCPQLYESCFRTLETLKIGNFHNTRSLFSSLMVENLVNLNYLWIENCDALEELLRNEKNNDEGTTCQITFPKLKTLELDGLKTLKSIAKGFESIGFPMLEDLWIESCPNLKRFVSPSEEGGQECNYDDEAFHLLCDKKVEIGRLKNLTLMYNNKGRILCSQIPGNFFRTLERLDIWGCHNFRSLFSPSMVEDLVNLNDLRIGDCDAVEDVLRKEKNMDEGKTCQVIFPKLMTLILTGLQTITSMTKGIQSIEFPMLEELKIRSCPKLKRIVSVTEYNGENGEGCNKDNGDEGFHVLCDEKVKFNKLEILEISDCHSLSSLFTSSVAGNLSTLKHINIERCRKIKKVITCENETYGNDIFFPSLEALRITNMALLEMLCEWICPLELSMLEEICVVGCPHLKFLTNGSLSTPKLKRMSVGDKTYEEEEWKVAEDLNKFVSQHVTATKEVWKLGVDIDVSESSQLNTSLLPHQPLPLTNAVWLFYKKSSGDDLVVISSNAEYSMMWYWMYRQSSISSGVPMLEQLTDGNLLSNELNNDAKSAQHNSIASLALAKNDWYLVYTSGGVVSLLDVDDFKVLETFMAPPPAATYLAFHPRDSDVIAVGMDDSTIQIYNSIRSKVITTFKSGHRKRITGLAFSESSKILVSSGADAQLCVWSISGWEKKNSRPIQVIPDYPAPLDGETRVHFFNDEVLLLVIHESQIAIYDPTLLECLHMWYPRDSLSSPISCATSSCDDQIIYVGFYDGAVGIFDAHDLALLCRIASSAYISSLIPGDGNAFPRVMDIAAHPKNPKQFALGLSNGTVYVIQPLDVKNKSKGLNSDENAMPPSIPSTSSMKVELLEASGHLNS